MEPAVQPRLTVTPSGPQTMAFGETRAFTAVLEGGPIDGDRVVTCSTPSPTVLTVNGCSVTANGVAGTGELVVTPRAFPNLAQRIPITTTGLTIRLTPRPTLTIDVGQTATITGAVTGGAFTLSRAVEWAGNDPAVITAVITDTVTLRVTGVAPGSVRYIARPRAGGGVADTVIVTVRASALFPTWTRTVLGGGTAPMRSVDVVSATAAWATDSSSRLWRLSGGTWTVVQSNTANTGTNLLVAAIDASRAWTAFTSTTARGFVYRAIGTPDSTVERVRPASERYDAIASRPGTTEVYAVGDSGVLMYAHTLLGATPQVFAFASRSRFTDVFFHSNSVGYAAGAGPVLQRFFNGGWNPVTPLPPLAGATDTRVWGTSDTDLYLGAVIGGELRVFRNDGTGWSSTPVLTLTGFTAGEWDAASATPTEWYVTGRTGIWRMRTGAPALQLLVGTPTQFATRLSIARDGALAIAVGPGGQLFTAPRVAP